MIAEVTVQSAALFAAGVVAFELALWYTAQLIWKAGLWKNDRNIARREQREAALQESSEA